MINRKKIGILVPILLVSFWINAQPKFGKDAMEIALPSVTGDTLMLSSLKGKVVLLDFWASWCPPCRAKNKELVRLYQKFKDKGFEIFGVSLDDDKSKWQKAIKHDRISWLQVVDVRKWDSATVDQWNLTAIPTSFLIDKEGKLVAMDLEGKDLENMLKDLLGG